MRVHRIGEAADRVAELLQHLAEFLRGSNPLDSDENQDGILDGQSIVGQVTMQRWELSSTRVAGISYIETEPTLEPVILNQLQWNPGPVTYDTSFGHRVRGYLTAPITGEYRFWVYGDESIAFWMSDNASSVYSQRLAFNTRWNLAGEFEQYTAQSSLPVQLIAGERYYFEIFHHGNAINDYFGVGWQYGAMFEPEIIDSSAIASFVMDAFDLDDDGLADADELAYGLDPLDALGAMGRFGDFDNDGFKNHWELSRDLDPSLVNAFPSKLRSQLFPSLADPDALDLTTWSLSTIGSHYQLEAFEQQDAVYLAASGQDSAQYAYAYQTVQAPVSLTSKLVFTHVEGTRAEAALMIRSSLAKNAAYYRIAFAPDGRVVSEVRTQSGGPLAKLQYRQPDPHAAVWLRLDYDGASLFSYYSYDKSQWFELDQLNLTAGETPTIGFAVTSFDSLAVAAAAFEEIVLDFDSDQDGLWNLQEATLGTDPELADSDGDGYQDAYELNYLKTDPLTADAWLYSEPVVSLVGQAATPLRGSWRVDGSSLYAMDYRGSLEFPLTVPTAGFYRLDVMVREADAYRGQSTFELNAKVGALSWGTQAAAATNVATSTLTYWSPWMSAGDHQLLLDWINVQRGSSLQIDLVELIPLRLDTPAVQQVWETQRLASEFEVADTLSSITSPWNLYGTAQNLELLAITADSTTVAITPQRALTATFHADIPLLPVLGTTQVDLDYANGFVTDQQSVQWSLTNLAEPAELPLTLRRGDSLLLGWRDLLDQAPTYGLFLEVFKVSDFDATLPTDTSRDTYYTLAAVAADADALSDFLATALADPFDATLAAVHDYQSGTLRAFANAEREYVSMASAPAGDVLLVDAFGLDSGEVATLALNAYGRFILRATWRDEAGIHVESIVALDVPELDLGGDLTVTTGYTRKWQPVQLPASAVLFADDSLYLTEYVESAPRTFALSSQSTQTARIAARIAEGGALVDAISLYPIVDYSSTFGGSLKILDTFTDGTQLVEFVVALGGELPDDFSILIQPYRAGVVFDDGTLARVITADDLDELGRYRYRMLLPVDVLGSACHSYQFQQSDIAIGKQI
jgi:hypothetical protein